MNETSRDTRNDYVPTDYEDLYRYYIEAKNSLCRNLIRKIAPHVTDDELETLANDVFARILATDQLAVFDATKANFGGVIFYVTRSIVVNHLARKGRNPLTGLNAGSLIENDPDEGEWIPGTYSLSRMQGKTQDLDAEIDARDLLRKITDWAEALAANPRNKRDQSIKPLLELMAEDLEPQVIADRLGVTASTVSNWMKYVREKATELRGEA